VDSYQEFLLGKTPAFIPKGFEPGRINPRLFLWQRAVVERACRLGTSAMFEDCGLGKTLQQLEWARQVGRYAGGKVLVLAPLAVAHQTVREGAAFSIPATYVRNAVESAAATSSIVVSNYERLEDLRAEDYAGVVLDESSILKAFSGKTKRQLVESFKSTPYRLACTATPAPNDILELGNHSEFLGVMPSSEMLARWFINDTKDAGTYRLKRHAEDDFWCWVASWSVCLGSPSDLLQEDGTPYSAKGYDLPPLRIVEHIVQAPDTGPEDGQLFRNVVVNATSLHRELRRSLTERAAMVADLVRSEPEESWVLWCTTNEEADALRARLPEAVEVRGSMDADDKARLLQDFGEGRVRWLITKGGIAGYGMNWQHCTRHAKLASNFSFEDFYQEVRRSWRFGQKREVVVHVVCASGEERIRSNVQAKQEAHAIQQRRMVEAQRKVQLEESRGPRAQVGEGYVRTESGDGWVVHHGDCVEVSRRVASDSAGLTLFSPPFSSLYVYSASLRDMGNCRDDAEFFEHFRHLVGELLRITKPGRLCVMHVKDLPRYRSDSGALGLRAFPDECVRLFESYRPPEDSPLAGARWVYHSRVTIWKSPVTEMQKTKSYGLLHKTIKSNASFNRQGLPDYLIVLRKSVPGDQCEEPVVHTDEDLPVEMWQRYASPVWMDVDQQRVLNVQIARANEDEKHLAPLQLDVVERCVHLWTNPGEVVFSPFAGIGSEGYGALRLGRRFEGVELKREYFDWACRNLRNARSQGELFGTETSSLG
jgi:hypothetical protein